MKTEVPLCKRCCFCVPLRYGLLVWGYLAMLPNILRLSLDAYTFYYITEIVQQLSVFDLILELFTFFINVGYFVLSLLLIVASHKKAARLLKVYYIYGLVIVGLNALMMIMSFVIDVVTLTEYDFIHWHLVAQFLIIFISVGLQLYILALVRSEILKLENISRFEFRNIAVEAQCSYYGPSDKPTNTTTVEH